MPELRQNYATRQWVIIASERSRRPSHFAEASDRQLTQERPAHDPTCPFCPGNEELDLEVERHPAHNPWETRAVRNKYPALAFDGVVQEQRDGVQRSIPAVGHHEVVIDHPLHNTTLGLMQPPEVTALLETLQRRGRVISSDPRIKQTIIFKNHGRRAGASLAHPHCQVIGLPVVPDITRNRLNLAREHMHEHGEHPIQRMLHDELQSGERLVMVTEHFAAFVLYAALSPFHMWVVPRRPRASFLHATPVELRDLATVLCSVLRRVYVGLNDPDFNMVIRTAPVSDEHNPLFHWYITIILRLSFLAGFEMGTGIYINPSLPEESARFLRAVQL